MSRRLQGREDKDSREKMMSESDRAEQNMTQQNNESKPVGANIVLMRSVLEQSEE